VVYYTIPMTRKGRLAEILSKAIHHDNTSDYQIGYRDYEQIVQVPLPEFLSLSENFQRIPASRIYWVKQKGICIYQRHNIT
jgi:hypothetical protein